MTDFLVSCAAVDEALRELGKPGTRAEARVCAVAEAYRDGRLVLRDPALTPDEQLVVAGQPWERYEMEDGFPCAWSGNLTLDKTADEAAVQAAVRILNGLGGK